MKKYYVLFSLIIIMSSCILFDAGNSDSKKIVGNIYVIDSDEPNAPGFYVIFLQKSGYERHLIKYDEHIDYLKANDTVMLVKTKANPNVAYYFIRHINGDSILTIKNLSDSQFNSFEHKMNTKYYFNSIKNKNG